jgi:ABC-type arginine transport system permease subunit
MLKKNANFSYNDAVSNYDSAMYTSIIRKISEIFILMILLFSCSIPVEEENNETKPELQN